MDLQRRGLLCAEIDLPFFFFFSADPVPPASKTNQQGE
jgi:hypothetical protein